MNDISRVSPALEPVSDFQDERPDKFEQRLGVVEDEVLPAGAATLLAVLQRVEPVGSGPGKITANPDGLRGMAAGADSPAEPPRESATPGVEPANRSLKKGDSEGVRIRAVAIGDDRAGRDRVSAGFDGPLREGMGVAPPALFISGERRAAETDVDATSVCPEVGEPVPAAEHRATADGSPATLPARPEFQLPAAQAPSAGEGTEPGSTSEQHDGAPPEPAGEDGDDTGRPFLQVPFNNERAQGEVLITREGSGSSDVLIRASDEQVFEQLQAHFDKSRQPHWWLDEWPAPGAPNDGGRRS
ncbi:hypothetical protein [Pseudomonas agarici]|uniref:hypothetical protein n=1 Tax=Pseudomonas agarici TaxID=46677 RepID=UPI00037401F9|nr:hypothetical protein [Pseudomonas agarici]NWB92886.1 hypothetical protein [Pseudomonas agarici]NWC09153.1 hypothetical protein [Pseudomonas agarici]SEK33123.1 hypothetical protein SAMN05216604_102152 [Pseudomonas agarici]